MKKYGLGTLATTLAAFLALAAPVDNASAQVNSWSRSAATFVPDDNTSAVEYNATNHGVITFQGSTIGDILFFGPVESGLATPNLLCLLALDTGADGFVEARLYEKSGVDGVSTVIATITSVDMPTVSMACVASPVLNHSTNTYYFRVRLHRTVATATLEFHTVRALPPPV